MAHVGQEFTLGPGSPDSFLPGMIQVPHLLSGDPEILEEHKQEYHQDSKTGADHHHHASGPDPVDHLIQLTVWHHCHQVPFRERKRSAIDLLPVSSQGKGVGVIYSFIQGLLQPGEICLQYLLVFLPVLLPEPFKIILPVKACAADDKGAIFPYNMGILHGVFAAFSQVKGIAEIFHRQGRHQCNGFASVTHGVSGRDPQKYHLPILDIQPYRHLLLPLPQGCQERLRVYDTQFIPIYHLKGTILPIEGQLVKIPGPGMELQILTHLLHSVFPGRNRLHQRPDLGQAQFHNRGKMGSDLLAHPSHVEASDLLNGIGTFPGSHRPQ